VRWPRSWLSAAPPWCCSTAPPGPRAAAGCDRRAGRRRPGRPGGGRRRGGRGRPPFGGLTALVNLAGGFRWETLDGGSVELGCTLRHELAQPVVASQAALPWLRRAGSSAIVNVGALAAAKAGAAWRLCGVQVRCGALDRSAGEELKDRGVRVNACCPASSTRLPTGPTCPTPSSRAGAAARAGRGHRLPAVRRRRRDQWRLPAGGGSRVKPWPLRAAQVPRSKQDE